MKKLIAVASALALLLGTPFGVRAQGAAPAGASAITPALALARVLSAPSVSPEWLSPSFAAQIPPARLAGDIEAYKKTLGAFERIAGNGTNGEFLAVFERGTLPALISIDDRGRIIELLFRVPQPYSLAGALDGLRTLPGSVGYVVMDGSKEVAAYGQDRELNAGSPKLAVLDAVAAEVAKGRRHWNDVVRVQPSWRSLAPGILQDWPAGSNVTLETLATLAASIGDNTAADALLHIVGREAVAPFAGSNEPFLSTKDAFVLQARQNGDLLDQWRSGSSGQRAVIAQLDRLPPPAAADVDANPANADIGWRYSNRQLCELISHVSTLPLMSVDPGVATPPDWENVAFASGQSAGAISMTTWLVAKDGKTYCASATWNTTDQRIDESTFSNAYLVLIASLRTP